jgi:hypothetical protein
LAGERVHCCNVEALGGGVGVGDLGLHQLVAALYRLVHDVEE